MLPGNKWEEVKQRGEAAIRSWIDKNMTGRSCVIVLIGSQTAGRKWVNYETKKGWDDGKGVLGVHIYKLLDRTGYATHKGSDPFDGFAVNKKPLSTWAKSYDPAGGDSKAAYATISANLDSWVEEAIRLRKLA